MAGVLWAGTQACSDGTDEGGPDPSGAGGNAEPDGSGGANGSGGVVSSGGSSSGGATFGGNGLGGSSEGGIGGDLPREGRCSEDSFANANGAGGTCTAHFTNYSFNPETGACEPFVYSGCHGNDNNFGTLAFCEAACVRN